MVINRGQKVDYNGYQQRTKVCLQWLSTEDKSVFTMVINRGQKVVYNGYRQRTKVCLQWLSTEDKRLYTMVINRGQKVSQAGFHIEINNLYFMCNFVKQNCLLKKLL